MQVPMQVNDSTAFVLTPVELPADLERTYCSLFLDCLLDFAPAHFWLDMSDPELKGALDHIHEEMFEFCNLDKYWALDRLFGCPPLPRTVWAVRRLLRALVPIPEAYWCRRIERREVQRRDEDEGMNGALTDADQVEVEEREGSDDSARTEESPAADSAAAFPRD